MALKPTIYKAQIELADSAITAEAGLTLAWHPRNHRSAWPRGLLAYCSDMPNGDWSSPGACRPPTDRDSLAA